MTMSAQNCQSEHGGGWSYISILHCGLIAQGSNFDYRKKIIQTEFQIFHEGNAFCIELKATVQRDGGNWIHNQAMH